jgi:hypothetical protein
MLSSDMQSCTKKANVMYTGQGNKEQVSQDLKDGFLIYMLTTRRPGMFVWCWTKGTLESIVVRFWVQKRRPGMFVWFWTKGTLESIVVRFWVQKRRPGIVVWIWTKGTIESIVVQFWVQELLNC